MNKKLIQLAVVAVVSSSVFTACNAPSGNTATASSSKDSSNVSIDAPSSNRIVYINSDSLIMNYNLFKELDAKYQDKATKVESELEKKSKALERKVMDLQNKASNGLITRAQAEQTQMNLQSEQQTILEFRDKSVNELREEEQVIFNNVKYDIDAYLKKLNEEKKYDLILSTNSASNVVMIGNPALDITKEVVEGMNKEYEAKKATEKK